MANYANLDAAIQAAIYENATNDITGTALQTVLLQMVTDLGKAGMLCNGVADGNTVPPASPDSNIFYIAPTGTYANFGGLTVAEGEWAIFIYNGSWQKQAIPVFSNKATLKDFSSTANAVFWEGKELKFEGTEWLQGYTIDRLTGAIQNTNNSNYYLSDYIYLNGFSGLLRLNAEYGNYATNSGLALFSAPYGASLIQTPFFALRPTDDILIYIPENAKYIRITKHSVRVPNPSATSTIYTPEEQMLQAKPIPMTRGLFLNLTNSLAVGDTFSFSFSSEATMSCTILEVAPGDVFTLNAVSPNKIYAILDSSCEVLETNTPSGQNVRYENHTVTIPAGGKYLCINSYIGWGLCYKGTTNIDKLAIWKGDEVSFRETSYPDFNTVYLNKTDGRLLSLEDSSIVNPRVEEFIKKINYSFDLTNYSQSFVDYFKIYAAPNVGDFPLPLLVKVTTTNNSLNGHFHLYDENGIELMDETITIQFGKVLTLWNLEPDHIYTWIYTNSTGVVTHDKGVIVPRGYPRFVKVMDANIPNRVDNVRDLGGWPIPYNKHTRYGLIFRGSDMNWGHTIDAAGINVMKNDLHIGCDIDLRSPGEYSPFLTESPLGNDVEWVNFSPTAYTITSTSGTAYANAIKKIVSNLSSDVVTYFHCKAGADRTGTLSLLVLGLLGVSESDLSKEYELTNARNRNVIDNNLNRDIPHLIATIKTYAGSTLQEQITTWALAFGVTQTEIDTLVDLMTVND